MAQLSDDCFAGGRKLMPADEALALLASRLAIVVETERVTLVGAAGRILAEELVSPVDVPAHANSAVDGYAVRFDDLSPDGPSRLPVAGRAAAGHPLGRPARPGEAIRIFTGAPMPDGLDTVMMQEDCSEEDGVVTIAPGIRRGANHRAAGEDVSAGSTVLKKGATLDPQSVGLAAAVGRSALIVYRPLRVAVFSTGDELREPDQDLPPGGVYDCNRFALITALGRLGCQVSDLGILADEPELIRGALGRAAAAHDLLVTSGGMSVGEEDHVRRAVEALGRLHFWMLAIKPGRPVALGQIDADGRQVPVVGLPGNPAAVMVTWMLIGRPIALRLAGASTGPPQRYQVRAGFAYNKKRDRREYVRARLRRGADGVLEAEQHGASGAGVLSSLVGADGLVELPEATTHVERGSLVDFLPFHEVLG